MGDEEMNVQEDEGTDATAPPPRPYITLTQDMQGGWKMDTNLQVGQAKWTLCEMAAVLMAELKPKG